MANLKPISHIAKSQTHKPLLAPAIATSPVASPNKWVPVEVPKPKLGKSGKPLSLYGECKHVLRRCGCPGSDGEGWDFITRLARVLYPGVQLNKQEAAALVIKVYRLRDWDFALKTKADKRRDKREARNAELGISVPRKPNPKPRKRGPEVWAKKNRKKQAERDEFRSETGVPDSEFYTSPAWRKVRYEALQASDGKCQLCGRGKHDGIILHVDHVQPRSRFPKLALELSNLQVLCEDCNMGKSNRSSDDWRQVG